MSSSYFALPGGKISFGPIDIDNYTIGEVKQHVFEQCGEKVAPLQRQNLWWNGYLLDCDLFNISEACAGIDKNAENVKGVKDLTIFLTIASEDSMKTMIRARKSSFDMRLEGFLMKQKKGKPEDKFLGKCVVS